MTTPADPKPSSIGIGGSVPPAGTGSPTTPVAEPVLSTNTQMADPVVPTTEPVTNAPEDMKLAGDTQPVPASNPVPPVAQPQVQPSPVAASPVTDTLPPIPAQTETPPVETANETKEETSEDEKDDEEGDEPQVVERVIIKEKGSGGGCFGFIRNLTCIVISMILLLIAAAVAIVIFKPAFITEPLKVFLNADYKPADVSEGTSSESVKNYIDEVTNATDGEVTFQITEDQLTTLVREKFDENVDVRTGMEENKLQLFIDIAQQGEPLWLIIELSDNGDNLTFSRIGFGRINTPPALRDFVKEQAFGLVGNVLKDFNFDNSESFAGNFVSGELREGVSIKEVKFAPDLMLVTVEL